MNIVCFGVLLFNDFLKIRNFFVDLRLYIRKILTNWRIVNFHKRDFLQIFFIILLLIVSLQEHEIYLLSISFALFVSNNVSSTMCLNSISS